MFANSREMYAELIPVVHNRLKDDGLAKLLCYISDFTFLHSAKSSSGLSLDMITGEGSESITDEEIRAKSNELFDDAHFSLNNFGIETCKHCKGDRYGGSIGKRDDQWYCLPIQWLHQLSVHPETFKYDDQPHPERIGHFLYGPQIDLDRRSILLYEQKLDALYDESPFRFPPEKRKNMRSEDVIQNEIQEVRARLLKYKRTAIDILRENNIHPDGRFKCPPEKDPLWKINEFLDEVGDFADYVPEWVADPSLHDDIEFAASLVEKEYKEADAEQRREDLLYPRHVDLKEIFSKYRYPDTFKRACRNFQTFKVCCPVLLK